MAIAFGNVGPCFDRGVLERCLGVRDEEASAWWDIFAGWYEGVLHESDGYVESPGVVELRVEGERRIIVEAHPGGLMLHLRRLSGQEEMLADFGPHYLIPVQSFDTARDLARGNPFTLLLFTPLVGLSSSDDQNAAEQEVADAWLASGIVTAQGAVDLAAEWARCALAVQQDGSH
jgi:hypothetical protein